jgi:hypothetical protein
MNRKLSCAGTRENLQEMDLGAIYRLWLGYFICLATPRLSCGNVMTTSPAWPRALSITFSR